MPQKNNYFSNDIGFFAILTLLLLLSTFPACVILNLYILSLLSRKKSECPFQTNLKLVIQASDPQGNGITRAYSMTPSAALLPPAAELNFS